MKTITYSILRQKISSITQYAGENEVTKLILDYTGLHTENWEKWVDLKMADGTTSFRFLGFDSVVEMLFTSAHTKFGSLYIQPYARLDDKKFMYDIGTLQVDESLLVTSDTSVITDDFIQYIDQMFDDYYTKSQIDGFLNAKQETLISGINIKTINNISVLGSGNIQISGGTGGASVTVGLEPPLNPENGDLWWSSDEGQLKIYYDDGDSSFWVDASSGGIVYEPSVYQNRWIDYALGYSVEPVQIFDNNDYTVFRYTYSDLSILYRKVSKISIEDIFYTSYVDGVLSGKISEKQI